MTHGGHHDRPKLRVIALAALIYFSVSGGPLGIEGAVGASSPLLTMIGFVFMPLMWSIPEALMTAELSTAFPEDSGYVAWVGGAFGSNMAFQEGWWSWVSGVMDNALYPMLMLSYAAATPGLERLREYGYRQAAGAAITVVLTFMNWLGLNVVGTTTMIIAAFGLLPFFVLVVMGAPSADFSRIWLLPDWNDVNYGEYFNILFWNLNYWDSASTLAGEVHDPHYTWPRAMLGAVGIVIFAYLGPLIVGIGVSKRPFTQWNSDSYNFADIANETVGKWLGSWIGLGAAVSNMGMFQAEMSSDSFQLLGMAERGLLPAVLAKRSRFGTPTLGCIMSATMVILLSFEDFSGIIEIENVLYCFASSLEWASFLYLRMHRPDLPRPYKIPLGTKGCIALAIPPLTMLVIVAAMVRMRTYIICSVVFVVGFAIPKVMATAKQRGWCAFIAASGEPYMDHMELHREEEYDNEKNEDYYGTVHHSATHQQPRARISVV